MEEEQAIKTGESKLASRFETETDLYFANLIEVKLCEAITGLCFAKLPQLLVKVLSGGENSRKLFDKR